MGNTITHAELFQKTLDKQMTAKLTSGWMEANAGQVIYNGGKTVKIPTISMQGLGNYSRSTGYVNGDVTLTYQTFDMKMDRGRSFSLDAMDVNETNFVANASTVLGVFQSTKVVPEVDAYRYATISSKIIATDVNFDRVTESYNPNAVDIYGKLISDIAKVRDKVGDIPLVITMSTAVSAILSQAGDLSRFISMTDFKKGEITTRVKSIDDTPIIEVPSARMFSKYTFAADGAGGFTKAADAKTINWMITPLHGPIAVSKTDKPRIFTPEQNQSADAYKIDYRKYHDVWITAEMLNVSLVNIKETKA